MKKLLELEAFTQENSALALNWRNSEAVRGNSINQSLISEQEHEDFLKQLNGQEDKAYFIVRYKHAPVATINFLRKDNQLEWGCSIADGHTLVPGLFIALIYIAGQYCFALKGCELLVSSVLQHNLPPQKANDFLGITESCRRVIRNSDGIEITLIDYQANQEQWKVVENKILSILPVALRESVLESINDISAGILNQDITSQC